jgi:hypothetical protein
MKHFSKLVLAAALLSTTSAEASPIRVMWGIPALPVAPYGIDLTFPDVNTTFPVDGTLTFLPVDTTSELPITTFHFDPGISHQVFSWAIPPVTVTDFVNGGKILLRTETTAEQWGNISPWMAISYRSAPVPEPSVFWLVGLGFVFAGLGGVARKKGV